MGAFHDVIHASPLFTALGDSAVTITLGEGISDEVSAAVQSAARALASARIAGVSDVVPAYAAVTVYYDPVATGYDDLRARLHEVLATLPSHLASFSADAASRAVIRIPVTYDGPDFDDVAAHTGLSRAEIIELHSGRDYRVLVIGFVPGFAYLGTLDPRLCVPRREAPRKRVPPGAVAIAESQTAVYPSATPGGWHILGTTGLVMFDARRTPPALLRTGDVVRFEPVAE